MNTCKTYTYFFISLATTFSAFSAHENAIDPLQQTSLNVGEAKSPRYLSEVRNLKSRLQTIRENTHVNYESE